MTTGGGRGIHVFDEVLYAVRGQSLESISGVGTATTIGTITGTGRVTQANDGDNLVVATGSTGYTYDKTTLANISDVDFPSTAFFPTFLDDYIIVLKQGTGQMNFALSDPTTWSGTDLTVVSARCRAS